MPAPLSPITATAANHYNWGEGCDGWVLAPGPDLLVIEERMPAGTRETRHRHAVARQVFYVLEGELTLEVDGVAHVLGAAASLEIAPGTAHQAINASGAPVRFLVISSPTTRGDRTEVR